jgi:hypothetical protein
VTFSIKPQSGGMSVFDLGRRRLFGPTKARTGVFVRFQTVSPPARLLLPQTGQQLRWGRLDVSLVRDERGVLRPRAIAVMPVNGYLRGLGEMPGSFASAALRAQAIAARSYAFVTTQIRGQHSGRGFWYGCDCAVYASVYDQLYGGYAYEVGTYGRRWVTAVSGIGSRSCAGGAGPCRRSPSSPPPPPPPPPRAGTPRATPSGERAPALVPGPGGPL